MVSHGIVPRHSAMASGSRFLPTSCFHGTAIESKIAFPFLPALVAVPFPEWQRTNGAHSAGGDMWGPCTPAVAVLFLA